MNVSDSTTCILHENLTNKQLTKYWETIDWEKVERYVNRIQVRITKAVLNNKWNLVKRLQYLLTQSFYAKLLAVRKVTSTKGKKTPGIDNEVWMDSKDKMKAVFKLTNKQYNPMPLKRIYIKKYGKKEKRPLSIPTMKDRAMQTLYLMTLEPIGETLSDKVSFGFRKYRSTHDAMQYTFCVMSRKASPTWILEGDIKGCFDNISHEWLMNNITMDKVILNKFLNAGFSHKKKLFPTDTGTAQGSPISPILANMTLDGMEHIIAKKYWINSAGNIDKKHKNKKKVNLIRLADDFIITTIDKETAVEVKEIIKGFLLERGLTLSKEKTQITNIEDGFDFSGWNFRKYNGKLIIKPSKKSANKICETVSKSIKENKTAKQESLIRMLNPIITGWANYHQSVCAKQTFSKIDHIIWNMLWKWCKRRHPNKNKDWIKKRYWHKLGNRNWVFKDGKSILERASDKPIVRHISLKLDKNPFIHTEYFEQRKMQQKYNKIDAYVETTVAQIRNGLLNA